jgi:hypothetical protein
VGFILSRPLADFARRDSRHSAGALVWERCLVGDGELGEPARWEGETRTGHGLAAADPDVYLSWDDSMFAGFIYHA